MEHISRKSPLILQVTGSSHLDSYLQGFPPKGLKRKAFSQVGYLNNNTDSPLNSLRYDSPD